MKQNFLKALIAGAALAVLAACGGGGGGAEGGIGGTGGGGDGGIGGTGVSYGTITGFGSVWVNGVEFRTTNTSIRIDDNPSREDQLRIGMVVRVDGSISGATATTITVDDAVKGRVEAPLANGTMVVMGQRIQVDANTRFDNGVVPGAGDLVEVHGLVAGDGVIAASYIERKTTAATPPFAVKGVVRNQSGNSFQIGTLTVTLAAGAVTGDMPAGSWNGLQVDVKGTACAGTPVCGTLTASKVEPAGANVASAAAAEIEGIVNAVTAGGFTIGNQRVTTGASTRYEGGVAADILVGTKVEAEGPISNGVLAATKVSIRDGVRIEADVDTVNIAAGTFTLAGLPGITVSTGGGTEFKDVTSVAALAPGNHLRLRGRPAANNGLVATELERRSVGSDTRVELRAAVQAVSGTSTVTLQGVVVDTAGVVFKNAADAVISRADFFAAIKVGSVVKARGDRAGTSVSWSELEIESP